MVPFYNTLQVVVPNGTAAMQVTDGTNESEFHYRNGTPEGNVVAPPGSLCQDTTAGAGALWIKVSGTGNTGWSQFSTSGSTNLSLANQTANTLDVLSDTGNDVTLPAATGTLAGLMPAADKVKTDFITVTQAVDLDAMELDISQHQTLLGVADGSVDLGTFTGTTITDSVTVKAAMQELETAVETKLSSTLADTQIFVGNGSNVATAVAMSGDATIANTGAITVVSASETVAGKVEIATPAEALTGTSTTLAVSPDALDSYMTTLVGNTTGVANLGTFTGTTIGDNVSVKTALQQVETFIEALVSGLAFAGTWDATTADPSAGMANQTYLRVSVAGTTSVTTVNLGAVTSWAVGDWLLKDNLGNLHKVDNTDPILLLQNVVHATLDVSNGGSSITLPAAVASTTLTASDGTAGVLSGNDKAKLDATRGYAETYGDGVATAYAITHSLGSLDVQVQVFRVADGIQVFPQIAKTSTTVATITHSIAPAASEFRVVVSRTAIA